VGWEFFCIFRDKRAKTGKTYGEKRVDGGFEVGGGDPFVGVSDRSF